MKMDLSQLKEFSKCNAVPALKQKQFNSSTIKQLNTDYAILRVASKQLQQVTAIPLPQVKHARQ
jgi:hypothetical protein